MEVNIEEYPKVESIKTVKSKISLNTEKSKIVSILSIDSTVESLNTSCSGICYIERDDIKHAKSQGIVFSVRIGGGAYSDVFKGTFNELIITAKIIHHNKYTDKDTLEQEKFVSNILREKTHKNVIKFVQIFDNYNKTETWILMEWINGKDMLQVLEERKIPFDESVAKDYFQQLIEGLKFLHSLGIVHRDIKPENIILCKSDDNIIPKYIDFGFAKRVDINEDKKALCNSHKGTLVYLAPEILAKESNYDAIKCDIYSLGVLLFITLFGCFPFDFDNDFLNNREFVDHLIEVKTHLNLEFPPDFDVSENVKQLIKDMLCKDSNKRPNIDQIMTSNWIRIE